MRIGPFQFSRARAAASTEPTSAPHTAAGASGTINLSGFLVPDDERNPELRGKEALKTLKRMERTDGAVREVYLHTTVPVLNATWDIDPAGDDPEDLEIAEFIRRAYFEWSLTPFKQTMQLTLKYLAQGFQIFELTEQVVEAELSYATPDGNTETVVPRRQFVTWRRWEHRRPETVYKWIAPEGELEQVVQHAYKDDNWGEWTMDAADLAVFVNEQEGDDFEGFSVIRPAYKSWKLKELVERVMAMSVEAHGVGIRAAYAPDDAKTDSAIVAALESQMQSLRAGESNYVVFPGPKATASTTGQPTSGYLFEIVTPPGGLPDFTPFLNYLRGDIKGAVLARFSELGHGGTGARSTSDSQSEVWYDALHAVADQISSVHNEKIKLLVDKNYANVERYPKLVARDIETKSLLEFANANAALFAAGAINADRSYRAYIRQGIDAPDEDEPEGDESADELTEPLDDIPTPAAPPASAEPDAAPEA